ncbi:hypothetical protein [Streptomonospora salina]|uniref:Uncharacterized protein n=1 Tax=Streptomonospora salina TaxID=104205 RepID=A0A841ELF2_9ACTN|nr:hypothetical protein [Streptomonospora salina]MBB6000231.1 hypothetical protein [Streptomonospora salina]
MAANTGKTTAPTRTRKAAPAKTANQKGNVNTTQQTPAPKPEPATEQTPAVKQDAKQSANIPGLPDVTKEQVDAAAEATTPAQPSKGDAASKSKEAAPKKTEGATAPAAETKPKAARAAKPTTYIRKDRTRRATGSRVQVLELTAPDAPVESIKPKTEDGKVYNFAAYCVTHEKTAFHETYGAAYKDSKVSNEWCDKCKIVNADAATKGK